MGISVLGTETGNISIVENKAIEHRLTHERVFL